MTCIVGVVHNGNVYIGGDSAGVNGCGVVFHRADHKVFAVGEAIFGFTDSFRMGQLLRHELSLPPRAEGQSDESYLVSKFIPAVIQCLQAGGWSQVENGRNVGGTFLLGYRGRLYRVCSDFQLGESLEAYCVCGSGEEIALGALAVLTDLPPIERLTRALEAAAKHHAYVRGPFNFVETPHA